MLSSMFKNRGDCERITAVAFSGEKVILNESGEKYAQIKQRFKAKTIQTWSEQICGWILM